MSRDDYAFHCAGCRCNHCANNAETGDKCAGEAIKACFVCDECNWYDGNLKNRDMTCKQCEDYIVTNQHAEYLRKTLDEIERDMDTLEFHCRKYVEADDEELMM